ncbi:MAG: right-handed parallel beta-helix repeat-containing protein [Chloroflexi bacterium]|nr:right-handed parallel beta-helix repeat-containing protein [Chloroflexota bacterium]
MPEPFKSGDLYVSPQGNDRWSGKLAAPNAKGNDGPVATLERARDLIRERKLRGELAGPLTVWVRGGRYPLSEPLTFSPADSAPVTYAAYPGEQPILDGGVRIGGWRVEQLGDRQVWVADVPEVAQGKWVFRQLFVNGQRRSRPRLPKEGFYWMANVPGLSMDAQLFEGSDTFQVEPGDIRPWKNLQDVDVVAIHFWIEERMPIASLDERTGTVVSSRRSMFALKDDVREKYAKYYVENVFEALTEPGEWYLDRAEGKLYYLPMPGEQLDTLEAYAPRIEYLLKLEGAAEAGQYVEFLRFEGLTFRHSAWSQPKGGGERFDKPGIEFAAAPQAAFNVPAAIHLSGARYCAIEDCTIEHIGWYGVELLDGCLGNRVVGNEIHDLGAGGVKLDGADAHGNPALRTGNNRITDNHIYDGGHVFHSACGILSVHSFGNSFSHNHIHDFYYTGISCGWVWGYAENVSKNNRIEKNHIHDLGKKLLSDMGGIYTLGVQPGTVLRGNLIHDVEKWNYGGWAIYPDEGSSHILIENNVCYNTSSQPFHEHYGRENIVRNNIFAFGREGQVRLSRAEDHLSFTFERNIILTNGQPIFVGGGRAPLEQRKFYSDLNLLWDVSEQAPFCADASQDADARQFFTKTFTLEEWQALGQDTHSVVADPKCADLANHDFTLAEDSPAFALGFQPIDLSDVGPRPKGQRDE